MVYFDEKMLKIFGRAMNFRGYALDSFVMNYSMSVSSLAIQSLLNNLAEMSDETDQQKIDQLMTDIGEYDYEKQIEFGEFLAEKLQEYPEVAKKVEQDVSDMNEGILASFLAMAPKDYLDEFLDYLGEKVKEKNELKAFFDKATQAKEATASPQV